MTDELYTVFEAEVVGLEEESGMQLITRSERKGLEKGRVEGSRNTILVFAKARFGMAPRGLEAALDKVASADALERLAQVAAQAESPMDLLEAVRREAGA